MFCEKCGTQLQDNEKFCPSCGYPVQGAANPAAGGAGTPDVNAVGRTVSVSQESLAGKNVVPAAGVMPQPGNVPQNGGKKPSKKKKGLIIGGVCAVAAAAVVCVCTFAFDLPGKISNFTKKNFSSPEEYLSYVVENNSAGTSQSTESLYKRVVSGKTDLFDINSSVGINVTLGDAGKQYLKLAGVDLSWLDSVGFDTGISVGKDVLGMDVSAGINSENLLSVLCALDIEDATVYLKVPELNDTYLGIDLRDAIGTSDAEMLSEMWEEVKDSYETVIDALPDQSTLDNLVERYIDAVVKSIDDVEKGTETLEAEGVSQKCTTLEIAIDAKTMANIIKGILDEAEDDGDLEEIFINIADLFGEDGVEIYDEFLAALEEGYDELKDARGIGEILYTLYVDNKGEIVGHRIESDAFEIAILSPQNGKKFGTEYSMSFDVDGEEQYIAFVGSGERSGDILSGEFEIDVDMSVYDYYTGQVDINGAIFNISVADLDMEAFNRGQFNGTVTYKPGKGMRSLLDAAGAYSGVMSFLEDFEIKLTGQSGDASSKTSMEVNYDGDNIIAISVNSETGNSPELKIPNDREVIYLKEAQDLTDWLGGIEWDGFVSSLDKAGLPGDVMGAVEEFVSLMESIDNNILGYLMQGQYYDDSYYYGW